MKSKIFILIIVLSSTIYSVAQTIQKGPYTVTVIDDGVFHIEDGNDSNPPGLVLGDDGKLISMNNCSDMYLIVGTEKALLIDLSNNVKWDESAVESLRSIVYDRAGNKDFFITVTHNHGDHLGMLPAFANDNKVRFWIPKAEFEGRQIFPNDRTTYFNENESLNMGSGSMIKTFEVPGHTAHSTLFFLKEKNVVFTGDAIGSGTGVWLFNEESFTAYKKSIDKLVAYIENPENGINLERLQIFGGHYWQGRQLGKLTSQYIYDMQTLIEEIGKGTAKMEDYTAQFPFLNANFKYGTATITWNKEAAQKYATSLKN